MSNVRCPMANECKTILLDHQDSRRPWRYLHWKLVIGNWAFILLFGFSALVGGCGASSDTTHSYFSPAWTRDGKIILLGSTNSVSRDVFGAQISSSYSEYIMTIYPAGTGESGALYDTTSARPYAMTCSPAGDYVAYGDDLRSGKYRKIVIRNIATGTHSGIELLEIAFTGVKAFDWSADGSKLVYCTTNEVRTRNWNDYTGATDALVVAVEAGATLESVCWRFGGRIAFVRASGADKLLSVIYPDGSGIINMLAALSVDLPQISALNTSEVYGVKGGALVKVNVDTSTATTVLSGFAGDLPRLASDGKQLTYSKTTESSGIYLIGDVTAASPTETKVK